MRVGAATRWNIREHSTSVRISLTGGPATTRSPGAASGPVVAVGGGAMRGRWQPAQFGRDGRKAREHRCPLGRHVRRLPRSGTTVSVGGPGPFLCPLQPLSTASPASPGSQPGNGLGRPQHGDRSDWNDNNAAPRASSPGDMEPAKRDAIPGHAEALSRLASTCRIVMLAAETSGAEIIDRSVSVVGCSAGDALSWGQA